MPSWQDTLIIAAGLIKEMRHETVQVNPALTNLAVWPAKAHSMDARATMLYIYPAADILLQTLWHSTSPQINTTNVGGTLIGSNVHVLPLHPSVDTIQLLAPASATVQADITWIIR